MRSLALSLSLYHILTSPLLKWGVARFTFDSGVFLVERSRSKLRYNTLLRLQHTREHKRVASIVTVCTLGDGRERHRETSA